MSYQEVIRDAITEHCSERVAERIAKVIGVAEDGQIITDHLKHRVNLALIRDTEEFSEYRDGFAAVSRVVDDIRATPEYEALELAIIKERRKQAGILTAVKPTTEAPAFNDDL